MADQLPFFKVAGEISTPNSLHQTTTLFTGIIPSLADIGPSHRAPMPARKARPSMGQIGAPGALRRLPRI